jgi:predicted nucleic acid-binding protein
MIVADTNLVAYLLISSPQTKIAQSVLNKDKAWCLPAFWRIEWLNVLANYVHHGGMPPLDALNLLQHSEHLGFIKDHAVDQAQALELSLSLKVTAYDAQFLALARHLNTVCVTSDKALRKAAPKLTIDPAAF